MQKNKKEDTT